MRVLPLVASHEKNGAGVERRLFKKVPLRYEEERKRSGGRGVAASELRPHSSKRQTLETPAAAPPSSAASAASCWGRGRRCSLEWPGSGVHGTAVLGFKKPQEWDCRLREVFLVGFCFFYEHRYSSKRQSASVWNRPGWRGSDCSYRLALGREWIGSNCLSDWKWQTQCPLF